MRLLRSKRGIGTVVASIMFLIISILFLGGTFLWQSTNQSHMNAMDKDRMEERVSVQATYKWNKPNETYDVTVEVSNIGTIDVEIIRLWILDKDHERGLNYHNNAHLSIDISCPLSVGGHTSIDEIDALITLFDDPEENPDYPFNVTHTTYYFKIVTARGNIANSRLVPYCILESQWPAVIMPGASYVTDKDRHIHLEVYNRLDEPITIDMIIATRYDPTLKIDIIYVDEFYDPDLLWILIPGDITVGNFWGENPEVYQKGNTILIELINVAGLVVSSYYFTVLP